jgi:hypothetical protein
VCEGKLKLSGDDELGLSSISTPEAAKHALLYTTPRVLHPAPVASPPHFHLSECLSSKGKHAKRITILVDDVLAQSTNRSFGRLAKTASCRCRGPEPVPSSFLSQQKTRTTSGKTPDRYIAVLAACYTLNYHGDCVPGATFAARQPPSPSTCGCAQTPWRPHVSLRASFSLISFLILVIVPEPP